MKLELLVSQSGNLIKVDLPKANSSPLIVRHLTGQLPNSDLDITILESLKASLERDILRAKQIQRKIEEPFLDSCFAKWSHSLNETEWGQFAAHLSILALIGPPLCKARELLVAIWGNACFLQMDDQMRWNLVTHDPISQKETKSSFYRLRPTQRDLYLVLCPSSALSGQYNQLLSKNLTSVGQEPLLDYGKELQKILDAKHSWSLMRPLRRTRWPFPDFWQKAGNLVKWKKGVKNPILSRKKVTTIATGILLSMLCTFFLLIYAKRSRVIHSPLPQVIERDYRDLIESENLQEESIKDKRFQPYSAWIAWLQKPMNRKISKDTTINYSTFLTDQELNRSNFGERGGKIKPSETLSLQLLEEEIQRDLANLRRHRESLAQIAKSQERDHNFTADKSPSLNWFEEEQKRSEQHLLLARSSLEKLSRRYGELSSLSTLAPQQPPSPTLSSLNPRSTDKVLDDHLPRKDRSQRTIPFAALTTLRQRLHFPLADWELPIVKQWIEQITGWGDAQDEKNF